MAQRKKLFPAIENEGVPAQNLREVKLRPPKVIFSGFERSSFARYGNTLGLRVFARSNYSSIYPKEETRVLFEVNHQKDQSSDSKLNVQGRYSGRFSVPENLEVE